MPVTFSAVLTTVRPALLLACAVLLAHVLAPSVMDVPACRAAWPALLVAALAWPETVSPAIAVLSATVPATFFALSMIFYASPWWYTRVRELSVETSGRPVNIACKENGCY